MALISVVIPTYNRARLVCETVASVLAQTLRPDEVIVVDDGSTDGTRAALDRFGTSVRYLWRPNGGAGAARNTGTAAASGEYIAFVDSDDLWLPRKLELQLAEIRRSRRAWVYCDTELFDGSSGRCLRIYRDRGPTGDVLTDARRLLFNCYIASPTPVVHRSVLERVGGFRESEAARMGSEDWELWLRIAALYPVAHVPEVLACTRVHGDNITSVGGPERMLSGRIAAIQQAARWRPDAYAPLACRALALAHLRAGYVLAGRGHPGRARQVLREAMRLDPWNPLPYLVWLLCPVGRAARVTYRRLTRLPG